MNHRNTLTVPKNVLCTEKQLYYSSSIYHSKIPKVNKEYDETEEEEEEEEEDEEADEEEEDDEKNTKIHRRKERQNSGGELTTERRMGIDAGDILGGRRGSKGNLMTKVSASTANPSRSLSFNAPKTMLKERSYQDGCGNSPKSPILANKGSRSPQPPQLSSPVHNGSSLNRRSFGSPDSKLVVLGVPCVGKSAVVVRLLTGRFIWEYDPTLEAVYRYSTTVDDDPALIEILDTAGLNDGTINEGHIRWGDGFLIVYSLTDRNSFLAVPDVHASIASLKHTPNFPCVLLANKSDLVHLAKVSEEEASAQASELGVSFFCASACEGSPSLWEAFYELHRDVVRRYRSRRRRSSAKVVIEGFYKMFTR